MNRRTLRVAFGVILGLLIALAVNRPQADRSTTFLQPVGPLLPQPFPAPEFVLLDPAGDTVRISDLRGAPAALFFGYTQCPDVCPITLAQLVRIRERRGLAPEDFRIVFVSLDPNRDTPAVMERFASNLGEGVLALTDREEEVWRQANQLGVQATKGPPIFEDDPNSYLVEHSARTFFLDDAGLIVAAADPMAPVEVVEEKVEAVLELIERR